MDDTKAPVGVGLTAIHEAPECTDHDARPIVTKTELDMLKAIFARPVTALTLEPVGFTAEQIRRDMEVMKQSRVSYLEGRLGRMKHRARDDFNLTQMHADLKEIERER